VRPVGSPMSNSRTKLEGLLGANSTWLPKQGSPESGTENNCPGVRRPDGKNVDVLLIGEPVRRAALCVQQPDVVTTRSFAGSSNLPAIWRETEGGVLTRLTNRAQAFSGAVQLGELADHFERAVRKQSAC
jgi:hypothetical protein